MKEDIIEAVQNGDADRIRQLLAINPNLIYTVTRSGRSLILLACYYRNHEIIQQLLNHHPDLDIFEASAVGDYDRVYDILKYNPDKVNEYSIDGLTPLGLASYFGHYDVVNMLIAKGAQVNIYSKAGMKEAPLHAAVSADNLEIAQLLLENKANPNAIEMRGQTPLHQAANNGNKDLTELLLQYGANADLKMINGETPVDIALRNHHTAVADLLHSHKNSYQKRG